jgi:hypothetical protein
MSVHGLQGFPHGFKGYPGTTECTSYFRALHAEVLTTCLSWAHVREQTPLRRMRTHAAAPGQLIYRVDTHLVDLVQALRLQERTCVHR